MNYFQSYCALVAKQTEVSKNYFLFSGCEIDKAFQYLFGIDLICKSSIKVVKPEVKRREAYVRIMANDLTVAVIKILNKIGIHYQISKDVIKIRYGYFMADKMTRNMFYSDSQMNQYICFMCDSKVKEKPESYDLYINNVCNDCALLN